MSLFGITHVEGLMGRLGPVYCCLHGMFECDCSGHICAQSLLCSDKCVFDDMDKEGL